jgi:uncharacterized protein (TIGR03067 family)
MQLLQGNWTVVSIKDSDPTKKPPEDYLKALTMNFKGDVMTVNEKGQPVMAYKVKLDSSKSPKTIDFVIEDGPAKGQSELGIYKIEGNTLTYCVDDPGKPRPTTFGTKEKSTIQILVLQKAK